MARSADPDRRARILAAARDVFRTEGYTNARMADVARGAGVASGTLYLYFASKDALVAALADEYVQQVALRVGAAINEPDPARSIEAGVHAAVAYAREERDLVRLFTLTSGLSESGDLVPSDKALLEMLAEHLEERMERGEFRRYPPMALAHLIRGTMECVSTACATGNDAEAAQHEQAVVEVLRRALIP